MEYQPDKMVRANLRYQRARLLLNVLVAITLLFTAGGVLYIAAETRDLTAETRDCNTPGRPCYEEEQERVRQAIATVIENQRIVVEEGSLPARQNLELTVVNSNNIERLCRELTINCEVPPKLEPGGD